MSFHINRDHIFDSLILTKRLDVPNIDITNHPNPMLNGQIVYNIPDGLLYYSSNRMWVLISGDGSGADTTTLSSAGGDTLIVNGLGPDLIIKGLSEGVGITFVDDGSSITINSSGTGMNVNLYSAGGTSL